MGEADRREVTEGRGVMGMEVPNGEVLGTDRKGGKEERKDGNTEGE